MHNRSIIRSEHDAAAGYGRATTLADYFTYNFTPVCHTALLPITCSTQLLHTNQHILLLQCKFGIALMFGLTLGVIGGSKGGSSSSSNMDYLLQLRTKSSLKLASYCRCN
jgi:hypothetical protein